MYISLVSPSVKHFLTCFLAICILSLGTCIFKYLACFSVGLFVTLLLSCKISLHILNTHLYQIYNLQIFFSHSRCCLFTSCVQGQGQRPREAVLHPRSVAAAGRSYPASEVRGSGREETPRVRGQWRPGGDTLCPRSGWRPGGDTPRPRSGVVRRSHLARGQGR